MENKFDWCIIDLDPLVYRCGFAVEKRDKESGLTLVEPLHHAYYNINSMMRRIIKLSKTEQYKGWLTSSDKSNFRFDIFPAYKSNRKDARKPIYYAELRDYLTTKWNAQTTSGQEADDQCSIDHCELNKFGFDGTTYNSVICSFDKDFNNIPGWHFNYVKDELYYITEIEALQNFYLQILTGDNSDGIPRIKKGWLQKKAETQIRLAKDEKTLYNIVYNEMKALGYTKVDLELRARLVWLRRKKDELWVAPTERLL